MNEYLLLKFAHLLAFVYWLGGDLGTFLASRYVIKDELSTESRHIALKIMLACDMGPKLAMPLIFPLGMQIAFSAGLVAAPLSVVIAMWLIAAYWFSVVLILYLNESKAFTARLSQLDFYFRLVVVVGLLGYAGSHLMDDATSVPAWLSWKILVFAALVGCGILIRINLKPFVPTFTRMMTEGASEESNTAMRQSIQRCRPLVWCIWGGLFLNAAIGLHLIN
ncbi:MAG: hypothetical protein ABJK20_08000 [Halieaceae bacterium]